MAWSIFLAFLIIYLALKKPGGFFSFFIFAITFSKELRDFQKNYIALTRFLSQCLFCVTCPMRDSKCSLCNRYWRGNFMLIDHICVLFIKLDTCRCMSSAIASNQKQIRNQFNLSSWRRDFDSISSMYHLIRIAMKTHYIKLSS